MQFYEVLAQVIELLQRQGRVSYRALKRQFDLDNDYLEDLKAEIIKAKRLAVDEDGDVLVWTGSGATPPAPPPPPAPAVAQPARVSPSLVVPPTPDAERRQLTVLFCDLVDSQGIATPNMLVIRAATFQFLGGFQAIPDAPQAEACFQQALAIARRQQA